MLWAVSCKHIEMGWAASRLRLVLSVGKASTSSGVSLASIGFPDWSK